MEGHQEERCLQLVQQFLKTIKRPVVLVQLRDKRTTQDEAIIWPKAISLLALRTCILTMCTIMERALGNRKQGQPSVSCEQTSVRTQPTFGDATTGFPAKWRLRNECRNSILMTRHYPDLGSASDWLNQISHALTFARQPGKEALNVLLRGF